MAEQATDDPLSILLARDVESQQEIQRLTAELEALRVRRSNEFDHLKELLRALVDPSVGELLAASFHELAQQLAGVRGDLQAFRDATDERLQRVEDALHPHPATVPTASDENAVRSAVAATERTEDQHLDVIFGDGGTIASTNTGHLSRVAADDLDAMLCG